MRPRSSGESRSCTSSATAACRRRGAPASSRGARRPAGAPFLDAANELARGGHDRTTRARRERAVRVRAARRRTGTAPCLRAGRTAAGSRRRSRTNGGAPAGARPLRDARRSPRERPCSSLERETLRRARVLWAISPASRRALALAARVPEERIRVVPIPVDAQRFSPLDDDEWKRGLERPQLMFVGRAADPRKNVALLLDAFARLRSRLPTCASRSSARRRRTGCPTASTCSARCRRWRSRFAARRSSSCRRCRRASASSSPRRSRLACPRS